jgi:hypothetical protein
VRLSLRTSVLLSSSWICFDINVLVKPLFVFSGKSPYGGRDHFYVEISVEVGVSDIPGRIYYVP